MFSRKKKKGFSKAIYKDLSHCYFTIAFLNSKSFPKVKVTSLDSTAMNHVTLTLLTVTVIIIMIITIIIPVIMVIITYI